MPEMTIRVEPRGDRMLRTLLVHVLVATIVGGGIDLMLRLRGAPIPLHSRDHSPTLHSR
jgi:hypothetical protein